MKVLLVNGSPNERGCTYTALCEVEKALRQEGVETGWFWIGRSDVTGCTGCGACGKLGRCVKNDAVNKFTDMAGEYDGFVFGSPVYFSGMNGAMMSFMDRAFYSGSRKEPGIFAYKPAAAVVSARRAGTTSALDQMNKYFLYCQMPVIPSRYWNMVHGNTPEEVLQDEEGLQIMRVLGRNMAWFLKLKAAGEAAGVPLPAKEERRIATNFIR
jgi:multimeric flavodoxin WrbA